MWRHRNARKTLNIAIRGSRQSSAPAHGPFKLTGAVWMVYLRSIQFAVPPHCGSAASIRKWQSANIRIRRNYSKLQMRWCLRTPQRSSWPKSQLWTPKTKEISGFGHGRPHFFSLSFPWYFWNVRRSITGATIFGLVEESFSILGPSRLLLFGAHMFGGGAQQAFFQLVALQFCLVRWGMADVLLPS